MVSLSDKNQTDDIEIYNNIYLPFVYSYWNG